MALTIHVTLEKVDVPAVAEDYDYRAQLRITVPPNMGEVGRAIAQALTSLPVSVTVILLGAAEVSMPTPPGRRFVLDEE